MTIEQTNQNPRLTKYLIEQNYLVEHPMVIVDIGARGGIEEHWYHFKDSLRLIGFEPDEDEFQNLNKQYADSPIKVYPHALHREKGSYLFYETYLPASSGFCKPDEEFLSRFCTAPNKKIYDSFPMEAIDFDTLAEQYSLPCIDFIKIDTEGCEWDILQGATKKIEQGVLGLNIEAWMTQVHKNQGVFCDIDRFLRDRHYEVYDMDVYKYSRKAMPKTTHPFAYGSGQVLWSQVLYLKDVVRELHQPEHQKFWTKNKVIKALSLYELYNLSDCAAELIIEAHKLKIFSKGESDKFLDLIVPHVPGEQHLSYEEYQAFTIFQDIISFLYELHIYKPEQHVYINSMLNALKRNFTRLALDSIIKNCAFLLTPPPQPDAKALWLSTYYQNLKKYHQTIIKLSEEKKIIIPQFSSHPLK